jgi:hypothetical protein
VPGGKRGKRRQQSRGGGGGGLTEHLNVPFGDGIEAAAGQQDNVGLCGLSHGADGSLSVVQGLPLFLCLQREKGRRGSGAGCCGLQGAASDANRVTPRLPLTLAAPAKSEAAFVLLCSVFLFFVQLLSRLWSWCPTLSFLSSPSTSLHHFFPLEFIYRAGWVTRAQNHGCL